MFFAVSILAVTITFLPSNSASHAADMGMLGLYVDEPSTTFEKPTGATLKSKSLCTATTGGVCRPGSPNQVNFPGTKGNGLGIAYTVASEIIATLWLSASTPGNTPVPIQGFTLSLLQGITGVSTLQADRGLKDSDGNLVQLNNVPEKIVLVFKKPGNLGISEMWNLGLRIAILGVGVQDNTNLDIRLHYGSAAHPSGVVYGVDKPMTTNRLGNVNFRLSLADNDLTFAYTDGGTAQTEPLAGGFPTPTEVLWGSAVSPGDYTLVSDLIFNATLQLPTASDGAVFLELSVRLYVNGVKYAGVTQNTDIHASTGTTAAEAAFLVVAGIPADGLEIAAGDTLEVKFALKAIVPQPASTYVVHYNAATVPSGFMAAAEGEASVPGSSATSGSTTDTEETTETSGGTESSGPTSTSTSTTATTATPTNESASAFEDEAKDKDLRDPAKLPGLTIGVAFAAAALGLLFLRRRD